MLKRGRKRTFTVHQRGRWCDGCSPHACETPKTSLLSPHLRRSPLRLQGNERNHWERHLRACLSSSCNKSDSHFKGELCPSYIYQHLQSLNSEGSCQMDLGSSLAPLFVLIYWVFPTPATCRSDKICCPEIPPVNLTETPPRECFVVSEKFRYQCKAGYKRKAGTSNLIRCIQTAHGVEWSQLNLICICVPPGSCGEPSSPPPAATGSSTSVPEATTSAAVAATSDGGASTETSLHLDLSDHHLNSTHIVSLCFALVFVCALAGMISFCFKRRTSGVTLPLPAEQIPINNDPLEADQ